MKTIFKKVLFFMGLSIASFTYADSYLVNADPVNIASEAGRAGVWTAAISNQYEHDGFFSYKDAGFFVPFNWYSNDKFLMRLNLYHVKAIDASAAKEQALSVLNTLTLNSCTTEMEGYILYCRYSYKDQNQNTIPNGADLWIKES